MGRRRRVIDDDGDSSEGERPGEEDDEGFSISNADLAEEAALFANPYGRKKRRTKEDSIYGIFGDGDNEQLNERGGRKNRYMSGVRFVSANDQAKDDESEYDSSEEETGDAGDGGAEEVKQDDPMDVDEDERPGLDAEPQQNQSQAADEDDMEERPRFGIGLGYGRAGLGAQDEDGVDVQRPSFGGAGLGFGGTGRGGLGSNARQTEVFADMPTAFGSQKKTKPKGRKPANDRSASNSPGIQQVDKNFGNWERSTKGIGSRLLEKMGWTKGMGLGKEKAGIAAPIDVKLRPKGAGLGLVDERTEAVKREQMVKGEMDEDEAYEGAAPPKAQPRTGQWKRSVKKKKVAYKSAQELIAEQEGAPVAPAGVAQATKILDMTGREVREVSDISEITSGTAAFDVTAARLPELRHNVGLLADVARQDLLHLTRQARIEKTRQQQLRRQQEAISTQAEEEKRRSIRLRAVVELANECQRYSQQFTYTLGEIDVNSLIQAFTGPFTKLQQEHFEEYQMYGLDELVVASLAPIVKKMLASWDPLADPTFGADAFRQWKKLLMTPTQRSPKKANMVMDGDEEANRKMTPYESMMYNIWLPKVRQAINNVWDPKQPDPAIALLEAWHAPPKRRRYHGMEDETSNDELSVLLPSWLYHNILEQLILPKLTRAVEDWNPSRDSVLVHTWIHPWLPHLSDRMDALFTTIRHKLDMSWRKWEGRDQGPLAILTPWKEVRCRMTTTRLVGR